MASVGFVTYLACEHQQFDRQNKVTKTLCKILIELVYPTVKF